VEGRPAAGDLDTVGLAAHRHRGVREPGDELGQQAARQQGATWLVDLHGDRDLRRDLQVGGPAGELAVRCLEDGQVSFLFGDRRLTTKLIEGSFPNVATLLPDSHDTSVVVERAALVEALQRVSIVAMGQANTPVSLTFGEGSVDLQATNQEMGDAAESLPAEIDGEGLTIAFNPTFLLAGLEATGTERIRIELRDGLKPAVLRPHDDDGPVDDLTYLLMPMRVT
jgi:DNA polymerase-3 subunit beta